MDIVTTIKPRIAFAGVGWIGRNRMQAVAQSGLAEIACFSDTSEECIAEASKIANAQRHCLSFEDAVDDDSIDAVVIATPSALHRDQAVYAFSKGKSVFCQKPLGRNGKEVKDVIDAAHNSNRLLGADFSYRYTSAFRKVLEVIRSGELGTIFAADLKFHNAYGPGKPWFYDIHLAGGGCVLDLGVHLIDLLLLSFDFPDVVDVSSKLFAKGKEIRGRDEVEDFADVMITLANGVHAHLSCSWNLNAGTDAIIEASFYGTHGGVTMRNDNGSFYDFSAHRFHGTSSYNLYSGGDAWGGRAIVQWVKDLGVSNEFREDAHNYLASAVTIDRIYENA